MSGRVFISCGQSSSVEKQAGQKIKELLRKTFGLDPYLAFQVQGLNDLMRITDELRASDYYFFIDFFRPGNPSISVFTHQELALAHHLGFQDIVALQQIGAPMVGFLRYVQSNPESFSDEADLLTKIERLVRDRGWRADYSRNLVVDYLGFTPLLQYTDHTGSYIETTYQVRVHNRRPDVAAVQAVCIMDRILFPNGILQPSPDRSYLKWAGQAGYDRTILPQDYGDIDLFSIHADRGGLFLHSLRDTPREMVVTANGNYTLMFKLFARGFQLVQFDVTLTLNWVPPQAFAWTNTSAAALVGRTRQPPPSTSNP